MKPKNRFPKITFLGIIFIFSTAVLFAQPPSRQEKPEVVVVVEPKESDLVIPQVPYETTSQEAGTEMPDSLDASDNVTLDFKEADILNVLKIISYKSGVNIVTTPEVMGNVSIRLVDVPWEKALDVILKTYGFGYERQGNIILVTKLENLAKIQTEEPLKTEVFVLRFLDAQDAQKILIPLLSPRGKVSVLYNRGQKGWQFGTFKIGKEEVSGAGGVVKEEVTSQDRPETVAIEKSPEGNFISRKADFDPSVKSKILIVTDTAASLDRIRNVIMPEIDKKPQQVLINARIMEVNRDKLKDIGFDYGTGSTGASGAYTTSPTGLPISSSGSDTLGGRNLGSKFTPGVFNPLEGTSAATGLPGTEPYKAGLEIIFKHLTGAQFEIILHALEEDVNTNTLSAPRILTLDNQEASIMVGYHRPIIKSEVSGGTATEPSKLAQTLDYYQEIGVRLNVVPQISEEGYINMIIHPSVTSSTSTVTATSVAGTVTATTDYPIIDVREAQTQVLMKDGETIVLGGLLKDIKSKEVIGIPFLSKIPVFGNLFKRETYDYQKIDLLIFITATILKEGEYPPERLKKLEYDLGKEYAPKRGIRPKNER
jgi:type IV pilus assembly protein PilQ